MHQIDAHSLFLILFSLRRRPLVLMWPQAKGHCKFEGNARTREVNLFLSTWNKYGTKNPSSTTIRELSSKKLGLQERAQHRDIHSQRYLLLSWDLLPIYTSRSETRASRKARLQLPGAARVISKRVAPSLCHFWLGLRWTPQSRGAEKSTVQ